MSRSVTSQSHLRCYRCLRAAPSHRASLLQAQASKDPPPVPPLQDIPPPPPPPPDAGPPRDVGFWTRRNIFGVLLVGSGLWYWKNYTDLDPQVTFNRRESTPEGMEIMITPTGEPYGVTLVPNSKYGGYNFLMLDAYGNIYWDPNDRTQGLYILDKDGNLVNAYVSSKIPGRVELERIGNVKDIKEIPIAGIADISIDAQGTTMWAFTDSEDKLKINPLALAQADLDGNLVATYPAQVNEGVIKVVKERKGLFDFLQKGRNDFGGPLKPDYLP